MPNLLRHFLDNLQTHNLLFWLVTIFPQPSILTPGTKQPYQPSSSTPSTPTTQNSTQPQSQSSTQNNKIFEDYPLETCKYKLTCRMLVYVMEAALLVAMLGICVAIPNPVFSLIHQAGDLESKLKSDKNQLYITIILLCRGILACIFILCTTLRSPPQYLLTKIIQIICLFLFHGPFPSKLLLLLYFIILLEYLTDITYIVCLEQRRGFIDSRLNYGKYLGRIGSNFVLTAVFNLIDFQKNGSSMILLLIACASLHCYLVKNDTIYSLPFRNGLFIMWTLVLFHMLYFFIFLLYSGPTIIPASILAVLVSFAVIVMGYYFRNHTFFWDFNEFELLHRNFNELKEKEMRMAYIWEAVRLITIGPENLPALGHVVYKIDWMLQKSNVQSVKNSQKANAYKNFHARFERYCYNILVQNFRDCQQFKYLLVFFFSSASAQKILLYLNKTDFFDVREFERMKKQHRSSDLAAKVNEMLKNQMQINQIIKNYLTKLQIFATTLSGSTSAIDLRSCQYIGNQLLLLQEQLFKFGNPASSTNTQADKTGINSDGYILSTYSRNLLDLVRKQLLGVPPLAPNYNEESISEVMNQQDPLIVISAELDSVGMIVGVNPATRRLTCFSEKQLIGQSINILLPDAIHAAHHKTMIMKASTYKMTQAEYAIKSMVYVQKKSKYCSLCTLSVRFLDGTSGRRWLARLREIETLTPFIICDDDHKVIGLNEAVHQLGIRLDVMGTSLSNQVVQKLTGTFHEQSERYTNLLSSFINSGQATRGITFRLTNLMAHPYNLSEDQYQNKEAMVECSVIGKVKQISGMEIFGYYIIRLVKIPDPQKLRVSRQGWMDQSKQNIASRTEKKSNQSNLKAAVQFAQKSKRRYSSKLHRLGIQTTKNESKFQFNFNPKQHIYSNYQSTEQKVLSTQSISQQQSYCSGKDGHYRIPKIIDTEDINQLIYIGGELQFRENKKLEQKHQCETHPLHQNLRNNNDPNSLQTNHIQNKNKIYQILGLQSQPNPNPNLNPKSPSIPYLSQHRILLISLTIFLILCCLISIPTILTLNHSTTQHINKLNTILHMTQRAQLYFNLATNMISYLVISLDSMIKPVINEGNLSVGGVMGMPELWLDVVKRVELKSSEIDSIDSIYSKFRDVDWEQEIPGLVVDTDYKNQLDVTFVDLLKLAQLAKDHPQISVTLVNGTTHLTINNQLLDYSLLVLRSLMQQIIPINLNLIEKTLTFYNNSIKKLLEILNICSIIFLILTIIIAIVVVIQIFLLDYQAYHHLELLTFFPIPYLNTFVAKLQEFQGKVSEKQDLTSEIGMDTLEDETVPNEELLPHKKKVNRASRKVHLLGVGIALGFVVIGVGFFVLVRSLVVIFENSLAIDDWFHLSNGRMLELNYSWQQKIIKLSYQNLPSVHSYFQASPFNPIPISSLSSEANRNYTSLLTQNLKNIYSGKFTPDFSIDVQNLLNQGLCDIKNNESMVQCQGKIANFTIESFVAYLEIKLYGLEVIMPGDGLPRDSDQFRTLIAFNSAQNEKVNQQRLLKANRLVIEKQLLRMQAKTEVGMLAGFIFLFVLTLICALLFIWHVRRSRKDIVTPILVLVRCFPLKMLNSNQPFLEWFENKKQAYLV